MTLHYGDLANRSDASDARSSLAMVVPSDLGESRVLHLPPSHHVPLHHAPVQPASVYRHGFKRAFDMTIVLMTLPAILLVVVLLAFLVAFDGGRPFYVQERVGQGGRAYRMWKLRSMMPDAEACLARHLDGDPSARLEWDHAQKLRADPRVTRIGRVLRKSSLDELPQLWNVLKGDMSLVGPRPMMTDQRHLYPGAAHYRLRPGITGPWQVSKRNASSFAERAVFDAQYDRDLSLWTDLRLLLATVRVVVRGTGC